MLSVPGSQRITYQWLSHLLIFGLYWGAALVVYHCLDPVEAAPCQVWLSGGVGLAAVIRWGPWMGLPIFFASFSFLYWNIDVVLKLAVIMAMANAGGAVLGGWLFRQKCVNPLPIYRIANVGWFVSLGVGVSTLFSAAGGYLYLLSRGSEVSTLWMQCLVWWLSDLSGSTTLAPLLLCFLVGKKCTGDRLKNRPERIETLLVSLLTLGLAWVIFFLLYSPEGQYTVMPYLLMLPLLWGAARLPLFFAQSLSFTVLVFALAAAATGHGAFYVSTPGVQLTNTALMILVQAVTLLVIGALVSERRAAEQHIRNINHSLEVKVAERTLQLAESESRLRLLADAAPFPMIMNRLADGHIIYANQRAKALFGIFPIVSGGTPRIHDFYANDQELNYIIHYLVRNGTLKDYEIQLKNNSGQTFWALLSCSLVRTGQTQYVIAGINDISERKELEQTLQAANRALRQHLEEIEGLQQGLRDQALRDPLTGLFNRRYLNEALPRILAQCVLLKQSLAVVMIDVDHFKGINDTYGHHGGDEVLSVLSGYLSDRFRSGDVVCRYGGEEFVIVLPDTSLETAKHKAEILCQEIQEQTFCADGNIITLTLSVGLAHSLYHGDDPGVLIHAADAALYTAKNQGRNQVVVALPHAKQLIEYPEADMLTEDPAPPAELE